jgi:hypothetical protein
VSQLLCATKVISDLIVFHFTTGAKVSLKSTPSLYSNPHATNLTLNFSGLTSRLGFTLYTQHVVIGFFHCGKSTSLQVWLFWIKSISCCMALNHLSCYDASWKFWGSLIYVVNKINYSSNVIHMHLHPNLLCPQKISSILVFFLLPVDIHCISSRAKVSLDKSSIEAPLGLKKCIWLAFIYNMFWWRSTWMHD